MEQRGVYERIFAQSRVAALLLDRFGRCVRLNPALTQVFGFASSELEGLAYDVFADVLWPNSGALPLLDSIIDGGGAAEWEFELRGVNHRRGRLDAGPEPRSTARSDMAGDGSSDPDETTARRQTWYRCRATPILDIGGSLDHIVVEHTDITVRRLAELALAESEERFRTIVTLGQPIVFLIDRDGRFELSEGRMLAALGLSPGEVVGQSALQLYRDVPEILRGLHQALAGEYSEATVRIGDVVVDAWFSPRRGPSGNVTGVVGMAVDITARISAEEALKESESRFRRMAEQLVDALFVTDTAGVVTYMSPSAEKLFGWTPEEMCGHVFIEFLPQSQIPVAMARFQESIADQRPTRHIELVMLRKDGSTFFGELSSSLAWRDGRVTGTLGLIRDISERKRAAMEREQLEDQLRQSQKMEAVGRLAGGIAHDFNNLLTAISGNVALSLMDISPEDPLAESLEEVARAADRAAELTRQLLAFSRKQLIAPRVISVHTLLIGLEQLLRRLLGEDIDLHLLPATSDTQVRADPSQIEQVIVNLAVNARDAMPTGGLLRIESTKVFLGDEACRGRGAITPGAFVEVAVADSGVGMDAATRARIFEPFFTTKPTGRGTGLGLATSLGIVEQHGGYISVESEVGKGTTFRVYLPCVSELPDSVPAAARRSVPPSGSETILVVEDEVLVQSIAIRVLQRQGYRVLHASTGAQALIVAAQHEGPLHLLVTDVVMPGMNGRELATKLRAVRPDLRVLYTSGYSDDIIGHHGVLGAGVEFLPKPYAPLVLAEKVRDVLRKS